MNICECYCSYYVFLQYTGLSPIYLLGFGSYLLSFMKEDEGNKFIKTFRVQHHLVDSEVLYILTCTLSNNRGPQRRG